MHAGNRGLARNVCFGRNRGKNLCTYGHVFRN